MNLFKNAKKILEKNNYTKMCIKTITKDINNMAKKGDNKVCYLGFLNELSNKKRTKEKNLIINHFKNKGFDIDITDYNLTISW